MSLAPTTRLRTSTLLSPLARRASVPSPTIGRSGSVAERHRLEAYAWPNFRRATGMVSSSFIGSLSTNSEKSSPSRCVMLTLKKVPDSARFAVRPPCATATPVAPNAKRPVVRATAVFFQLNFPMGATFHRCATVLTNAPSGAAGSAEVGPETSAKTTRSCMSCHTLSRLRWPRPNRIS